MNIAENIINLKNRIPNHVKLIAVSKTKPNKEILEAYNAGQRIFGENKVQEIVRKHDELPKDIIWHFIGHLQRNKVKYIVPIVSLIHAVDSLRLLRTINNEAEKQGKIINCLMQVNIAEEETKFGLSYLELKEILDSEEYAAFRNVRIFGLMGMATYTTDIKKIRNEFRNLKLLFDKIKKSHFSDSEFFKEISMGMSGDFVIAVEEGSTMIRVGSMIFGDRNY